MKQTLNKLILFFFCFSICLSTPSYSQFKFSQIKVQGNSNTDVETIKSISGLKKNISLSASDINLALKNLYNSNLFESVQVVPKGQTILIKVKENKRIRRLVFEGNKKIEENIIFLLFSSFTVKPLNFLLGNFCPSTVKGIDLSALILIFLFFKIKTFIVGTLSASKGLA